MALTAAAVATITVLIYNPGTVPERTLNRACKVAARILAPAGVALAWRAARVEDAMPASSEIPIHLLTARPATLHHDAEGFAVLHLGSAGDSYAGISYPAVIDTANAVDAEVALVLGVALAHELGHVLLNSPAHAPNGVMCARLQSRELAAAARGELHFTSGEYATLRAAARRRATGR